jgi:hypothetical protein
VPDDLNNELDVFVYRQPAEGFYIGVEVAGAGQLRIKWEPVAGQSYQLQSAAAATGPWSDLGNPSPAPVSETTVAIDPGKQQQFFRLRLAP